jgi:hypothetical protein
MTHEELDALWNKSVNISITAGDGLARYRYAEYVAAAEREACAKICDGYKEYGDPITNWAVDCAAAIRARGSK